MTKKHPQQVHFTGQPQVGNVNALIYNGEDKKAGNPFHFDYQHKTTVVQEKMSRHYRGLIKARGHLKNKQQQHTNSSSNSNASSTKGNSFVWQVGGKGKNVRVLAVQEAELTLLVCSNVAASGGKHNGQLVRHGVPHMNTKGHYLTLLIDCELVCAGALM